MTAPTPETFPLGPGELKIGATGTEIDVSCLVNNAVLSMDKDEGDSETKLCGTVKPGAVTYTFTLAGNMDLDIADDAGFFALSQTAAGTEQTFSYTPSTDAGTKAAGTLVIDPMPFGGDETGTTMAGDFEFTLVGKPTYTFAGGAELLVGGQTARNAPVSDDDDGAEESTRREAVDA